MSIVSNLHKSYKSITELRLKLPADDNVELEESFLYLKEKPLFDLMRIKNTGSHVQVRQFSQLTVERVYKEGYDQYVLVLTAFYRTEFIDLERKSLKLFKLKSLNILRYRS